MAALLRCKPPEGAALHEPIHFRLQLLHMLSSSTKPFKGTFNDYQTDYRRHYRRYKRTVHRVL